MPTAHCSCVRINAGVRAMSSDVSITYVGAVAPEAARLVQEMAATSEMLLDTPAALQLSGTTKGGWALTQAGHLLEERSFKALEFLAGESGRKIQVEDRLRFLVVLAGSERRQAASEMRALMDELVREPKSLMRICPGFLDESQVVAALRRDYTQLASSNLNRALRADDEGEGDEFLCAYLKSTLDVLLCADKSNLVFVHATDWWGRDAWMEENAIERVAQIPERFRAGLGFPAGARNLVDIRLKSGRVLFSIPIVDWCILEETSPQGEPVRLGIGTDDIVAVRLARRNLKTLFGLW